ncbi:adenosylcobinamide-phosphate synthase CbiB [Paenibacillus roseipurpureus]|uniref:Cobalamin biosynthesis protein CobD n=1 Tax=Paenibacillus roseopurpureus TaxID=2918901 RepID=A0AA96LM09_9BACL|nr:adenosylcobinamide-phosphate synthase CbiB [Paenibacillus sp. MBLB1832]WNR43591.1 adenosylcobinamide-phosphate synthase CbiB [Paenibacillus sp. MBLB1832]
MWLYSPLEIVSMTAAAIMLDWLIGDPKWPTHPVIWIGRWIRWMEHKLHPGKNGDVTSVAANPRWVKWKGVVLTISTVALSFGIVLLFVSTAHRIHPWLGYAVSTWLIATTVAIKGLKDAAYLVYRPLRTGNLADARKYTGYIVGRDTAHLPEAELTRAVVETVAENIVDAVVAPLIYALLGGSPLAMLYRASNTLDSMVGYRNDRYRHFGWASARWDDVMNWLPARLTGALLVLTALLTPGCSAGRAAAAIRRFAHLHPSPNSGIPESAVAGALGIELGGLNSYGGAASERARLGWPLRPRTQQDIVYAVRMLYGVSFIMMGGLLCVIFVLG